MTLQAEGLAKSLYGLHFVCAAKRKGQPSIDSCPSPWVQNGNPGLLALLVLVHVHAAPSDGSPQVFQPLGLLDVDAVLVLVDVDEGVADAGHAVGQSRECGRLNVLRLVARHEEGHQRLGQFRLVGALRSENVQQGEEARLNPITSPPASFRPVYTRPWRVSVAAVGLGGHRGEILLGSYRYRCDYQWMIALLARTSILY